MGQFSSQLVPGRNYTRRELAQMLGYGGVSALGSGVITPASFDSILLFVTRTKQKDRTQYEDKLEGDVLYWEGQKSKKTDGRIIGAQNSGEELLLFYRPKKNHYEAYAFRYEGRFRYHGHTETPPRAPTRFVLVRAEGAATLPEAFGGPPQAATVFERQVAWSAPAHVPAPSSIYAPAVPARRDLPSWLPKSVDLQFAAVLMHIERYGSISEAEAARMVSGARRLRRLSRDLAGLTQHAPFRVLRSGDQFRRMER